MNLKVGQPILTVAAGDVARWFPARRNSRDLNKASFGRALIFAGSRDYAGAAVLSSEAAIRVGAGIVTLVVPEGARAAVESRLSPVIITRGSADDGRGFFCAQGASAALTWAEGASALALGPGVGTEAETGAFVREIVTHGLAPLVLDADALNLLAMAPGRGQAMVRARKGPTILTPHPGEMARLLGCPTIEVQKNRERAVLEAAKAFGCVVILKGYESLVADASGACYVNKTGNAGMATAGAGDVLTGIVAGLLAQGLKPLEAAAGGVFLHGLCGDLAAQEAGGVTGLIATDLIKFLPRAIAQTQASDGSPDPA